MVKNGQRLGLCHDICGLSFDMKEGFLPPLFSFFLQKEKENSSLIHPTGWIDAMQKAPSCVPRQSYLLWRYVTTYPCTGAGTTHLCCHDQLKRFSVSQSHRGRHTGAAGVCPTTPMASAKDLSRRCKYSATQLPDCAKDGRC